MSNETRPSTKIPATPYMKLVKIFALAKGMKFFTWEDQITAAWRYSETAKILN